MADILTIPDLETRLRTAWPTLPADERQLILDLVWATAGPDSALADVIDDLEATLAYDATVGERDAAVPWEDSEREHVHTPAQDLDIMDWDVIMAAPPPIASGVMEVELEYAGPSQPLALDDPWLE